MAATCKTCHAAIRWVTLMPSGKRMPIDHAPDDNGNVVLLGDLGDDPLYAEVLNARAVAMLPATHARYVSHFATCADHAHHRRPRAKASTNA